MSQPAFLVSHRGALGDFLLTWPTIISLRRHFASFFFIAFGKPEYLRLAQHFALFDEVYDCESKELLNFYSGKSLPDICKNTEIILCWMEKDENFKNFLISSGINQVYLHPPFPKNEKQHVLEYHFQILDHFSIPRPEKKELCLPLSFQKSEIVLIHPGSGSDNKNFEPEFYAFIANEFKNKGFEDIRFILGPGENKIRKKFKDRFPLVEPSQLIDLAEVLSSARLFVGNDSGVTHLAAFLGVPTIALFKSTDPSVWGVRGLKTETIEAATESLAMAKILKILPEFLSPKKSASGN